MGIFTLEKRNGKIDSVVTKTYRNTRLEEKPFKRTHYFTYKFECKLNGETLVLNSSDKTTILNGDTIVAYGLPRWRNKFEILLIANLSRNKFVVTTHILRRLLFSAGTFLIFLTTLYSIFERGIPYDNLMGFTVFVLATILLPIVFLYKPYFTYQSAKRLKKEYDISYGMWT